MDDDGPPSSSSRADGRKRTRNRSGGSQSTRKRTKRAHRKGTRPREAKSEASGARTLSDRRLHSPRRDSLGENGLGEGGGGGGLKCTNPRRQDDDENKTPKILSHRVECISPPPGFQSSPSMNRDRGKAEAAQVVARTRQNLSWGLLSREAGGSRGLWEGREGTPRCNESFISRMRGCGYLRGHNGCVNALSFDSSGRYVVTGSDDATVKLWDLSKIKDLRPGICRAMFPTYKDIATFKGHVTNVFCTNFAPSGRFIASSGNDGNVRLFDVETNTCVFRFNHHTRKVLSFKFESETCVVTCSADSTIRRFDTRVDKSAPLDSDICPHILPQNVGGGSIYSEEIPNRNSSLLMLGSENGGLPLFSLDIRPTNSHHIVVSAGAKTYLIDTRRIPRRSPRVSSRFCVSDVALQTFENQLRFPCLHEATGCCFDPSGESVLTTNLCDALYLHRVGVSAAQKPKNVIKLHHSNLQTSPAARTILEEVELEGKEGKRNPRLVVEDITEQRLYALRSLQANQLRSQFRDLLLSQRDAVGYAGDVKTITDQLELGKLRYDPQRAKTYTHKYSGHLHCDTVKGCSFFGNDYVMSGSDDGKIYIWKKDTGSLVRVLDGLGCIINNVESHPTAPIIASAGIDKYATIWDPSGPPQTDLEWEEEKESLTRLRDENESIIRGNHWEMMIMSIMNPSFDD